MTARGLLIAAPSSGSGKTLMTLSLLRLLHRKGFAVSSLKVGPDYIDPMFHEKASGRACVNIDPWAMRKDLRGCVLHQAAEQSDMVIVEGVMGLFDAATDGVGSSADIAAEADLPVLLVVDSQKLGASVAAIIRGFVDHRPDVRIAGVLFNRVGSDIHEQLLRDAVAPLGIPVAGAVRRNPRLELPDRHLGLVQPVEHGDIDLFMEEAADHLDSSLDVDVLINLMDPITASEQSISVLSPPGQRIAIARDEAFGFAYPHLVNGWRDQGAEIAFFSPLNDEAVPGDMDAIYLPGGYPELHAGRIATAQTFLTSLRQRAESGSTIYGECGGYMTLGEALQDADGAWHSMAGLLPLKTSFAQRRIHLGYRRIRIEQDCPFGSVGTAVMGHEFHYASTVHEDLSQADRLFSCTDARGERAQQAGLKRGTVMGSFMHLIDRV